MISANRLRNSVIVMVVSFGIAVGINTIMLENLGEKSEYRAEHSLVGIVMLMGFVYSLRPLLPSRLKLILLFFGSLLPCYLGTVFPDLDIRLLGIGGHRNPLFHSGMVFFCLAIGFRRHRSLVLAVVLAAFGVGLASHLAWDLFDHADVRWIPGGQLDRAWIAVNTVLCLIVARTGLATRIRQNIP